MAVFPPNEDIVTIAIDAARKALSSIEDKNAVDLLIFATESSFDLSKSAGIYVHKFLGLREDCRAFDLKQACYSAAAALRLAESYAANNPRSKVLIVGSDVIKYPPSASGEPTQGGAAIAFVVSQNPRILEIEPYAGVHTDDIMDFWRPAHLDNALFDGKLSAYNYLKSLDICLERYFKNSALKLSDIDCACFHSPFGKMARKANNQSFKYKSLDKTLIYSSIIGNSCSASLFICFLSLLDHAKDDLTGKRIGFFSYGSGSVAEFFSGVVRKGYKRELRAEENQKMLADRIEISFSEYEKLYSGEFRDFDKYQNIGSVKLSKIDNYRRIYENIGG
jgi:hydroxymethylglutaryl-CoA synthase